MLFALGKQIVKICKKMLQLQLLIKTNILTKIQSVRQLGLGLLHRKSDTSRPRCIESGTSMSTIHRAKNIDI